MYIIIGLKCDLNKYTKYSLLYYLSLMCTNGFIIINNDDRI